MAWALPLISLEEMTPIYGLDHYKADGAFAVLFKAFRGSSVDEKWLSSIGQLAGGKLLEASYRVDLMSQPFLQYWSYRGKRVDLALLDPLEREVLLELVEDLGVNARPFAGGSWLDHYAGIYLVGDPGISCILTITVQTAYALYKYGEENIQRLYKPLAGLERPVSWGATWFTEVQGGSDLGRNETIAEEAGEGVWRLHGYKYFASGAGVADYALVSARPKGAPGGVKGLGLYLVPRLWEGRRNYEVVRLKYKSATIPVPTGEVELRGSMAWEIAGPPKGIYLILEDLMVSRLANSMGALGIARKAYMESYLYAVGREAFGRKIAEHPLAQRDLLEMELEIEATLALTLRAVKAFDDIWLEERPPYSPKYHVARLLTHTAKNLTADAGAFVTARAMEMWGGIGFLREFHVERWHREAMITPIWEGTSNIQALDWLEAIERKRAWKPAVEDINEAARDAADRETAEKAARIAEEALREALSLGPVEAQWRAKELLQTYGRAASVVYMLRAAEETGDEALRWAGRAYLEWRLLGKSTPMPGKSTLWELLTLRNGLANL